MRAFYFTDRVKQQAAGEALAQLELSGCDILDHSWEEQDCHTLTIPTAVPSPVRRRPQTLDLNIDTSTHVTPIAHEDKDWCISPLQLDNDWSPLLPKSQLDSLPDSLPDSTW